ncbi:MAG TPA: hypothetical protein VHS32_08530 [Streptosporangiaceae bacterium]|nr:hypothetical protein [Streptosporangiaceae bacterium]
MITRAQIEKLGALHAVESTMLSLYLAVPPSANLTARAGELIAAAEAACGRPQAGRDRTGCWRSCHRASVTAPGPRWRPVRHAEPRCRRLLPGLGHRGAAGAGRHRGNGQPRPGRRRRRLGGRRRLAPQPARLP